MSANNLSKGFTLVEILVIAPIVILVISGFVALIITITGDVLRTAETNKVIYNTQAALNMFEDDIRLTTQFLTTSMTPTPPQGLNNDNTAFVLSGTTPTTTYGIYKALATTKNPLDPTNELVYIKNTPYDCSDPDLYKQNTPYTVNYVYFYTFSSGEYTLWRRTLLDQTSPTNLCGTVWQQPSCAASVVAEGSYPTVCKTEDTVILRNLTLISVAYYDNPSYATQITYGNIPSSGVSINMGLTAGKTIAGRPFSFKATLRATKINMP